jgi:hypothetical protein
METTLKLLALTDGRDKFIKIVQYTLKFIFHFSANKPWAPGIKNIIRSLSTARRVWRVGNEIKSITAFSKMNFSLAWISSTASLGSSMFDDAGFLLYFIILSECLRLV